MNRRRFLLQSGSSLLPLLLLGSGCSATRSVPPTSVSTEPLLRPALPEVVSSAAEAELPTTQLPELLPIPDLSDSQVLRFAAGIRPYRRNSYRVQRQKWIDGRILIHNYGHGGAGITMAPGSAQAAVDLLQDDNPTSVAVLGAGVIGLNTALELRRRGYTVVVYAASRGTETTSGVAGGQWAPSLIACGRGAEARSRFHKQLRVSHRAYAELISDEWGISERRNYVLGDGGGLRRAPAELLPVEKLARLPFGGSPRAGWCYRTLLIEPPVYLPRLEEELIALGVEFRERQFRSREEVEQLSEAAVFNCLGFGAKSLFADQALLPMRGQLVHISPQDIDYLLNHDGGYFFPRRDSIVLGGTVEWRKDSAVPAKKTCERILSRHRKFFASVSGAPAESLLGREGAQPQSL